MNDKNIWERYVEPQVWKESIALCEKLTPALSVDYLRWFSWPNEFQLALIKNYAPLGCVRLQYCLGVNIKDYARGEVKPFPLVFPVDGEGNKIHDPNGMKDGGGDGDGFNIAQFCPPDCDED